MEERRVFNMINEMLEDTDYPLEIRNMADLEEFLNDEDNREMEAYEEIGKLYDNLVFMDDMDGFPEGE